MENIVQDTSHPNAVVLQLKDLPAYNLHKPALGQCNDQEISGYLRQLLDKQSCDKDCTVLLPSLDMMSRFFNCSSEALHRIFMQMRAQGYDVVFAGLYGHISLWKKEGRQTFQGGLFTNLRNLIHRF